MAKVVHLVFIELEEAERKVFQGEQAFKGGASVSWRADMLILLHVNELTK